MTSDIHRFDPQWTKVTAGFIYTNGIFYKIQCEPTHGSALIA